MRVDDLRTAVREALGPSRRGRRDTIEAHPLIVIARVISRFVATYPEAQQGLSLGEASALGEKAIEAAFDDGHGISAEEIAEWLQWTRYMRDAATPKPHQVSGVELMTHLAVLALRKLLELRRLAPEMACLLCMTLNGMDDELAKQLREHYGLRPAILGELVRCFDAMPGRVRHADLAARFKWGLAATALDKEGLFDVGLGVLRELPEAIANRIQETCDGEGPGLCPNGRRVSPLLEVGRRLEGLGLVLRQGAVSLACAQRACGWV